MDQKVFLFWLSSIGFTGNVVAVMHGANAPLMKVYPAPKTPILAWSSELQISFSNNVSKEGLKTMYVKVMVAQEVAKERAVLAGQGERREIPLQVSEL